VLAANHIPDIGAFPTAPIDNTSLESVPFLVPTIVLIGGLALNFAQAEHCKKISIISEADTATTTLTNDAYAAVGKWAGVKVAPPENVPSTQSDYAPIIAILDGEGVDCVADDTGGSASASLGPILTAIADSGIPMKVDFVGVGITSSELQAVGSAVNNVTAIVSGEDDALVNLVSPVKVTPQERTMISQWNQYEPAATPNDNLDMPGWVGADAAAIVMKQAIKEHLAITGANLIKVLRSNFTIDTGVEPAANFSSPGLIPGYNRIHNTYVNFIKIVNYQEQPNGFILHNFGPALTKFKG
jgi:hypothetical protein